MSCVCVDVGVVPVAEKDRNGKVTRKQTEKIRLLPQNGKKRIFYKNMVQLRLFWEIVSLYYFWSNTPSIPAFSTQLRISCISVL